jgi:predicted nicotinamide N-methyase
MTTPLRIRYQTVEIGSNDIHLCTLRDKQQFSDPEGVAKKMGINSAVWPIFGTIWPSSLVLAHFIDNYQTVGKRVLEIGCGMALTSLMLNKKHADITATDYHPEVEFFLKRNATLNHDDEINYERTDWSQSTDSLGRFDLIVGSDVLYEDQHVKQLADFIEHHSQPTCEVILVDPGRGRKNKLGLQMEKYGFQYTHTKAAPASYLKQTFNGYILKFWRER